MPRGAEGKLEKHVKSRCHGLSPERFTTAQSCSRDPSKRVDIMLGEENKRLLAQTEAQKKEIETQLARLLIALDFWQSKDLHFGVTMSLVQAIVVISLNSFILVQAIVVISLNSFIFWPSTTHHYNTG